MQRLTTTLLCVAIALGMTAQTARDEIRTNKYLAGSNYVDYDRQLPTRELTPAPKGYVPYYLSHYGRHGSRWLIGKDSYTRVVEPLRKAQSAGHLTAKGEELLRQLELFVSQPAPNYPALDGRWQGVQPRLGDLTTVGERQHHGIGRRMVQHFPEIFKTKNIPVDARSTTVGRCILSMMAECEELAAANPTARIRNDVSDALQYYLNQPWSGLVKQQGRKGRELRRSIKPRTSPDRLMGVLFDDAAWAKEHLKPAELMYNLFEVATNMQSHDTGYDLYPLFTDDEVYDQWRTRNIGWYLDYGAAPQTQGVMPFSQKNLLRNIIETADTVRQTQATLRFGHEVCVMPLACLLELDSCGASVNDLDQLDRVWRNYRIFPMACNIQLVFYRPKRGQGDILVKALLNERECTLPVSTTQHPYYKWSDLRQYYLDKLDGFERLEAAAQADKEAAGDEYAKYYRNLPVHITPVSRPVIPGRSIDLREAGGTGDGVTLNTDVFDQCISQLARQGGGRLNVPAGVWLTGPIRLQSGVELHLDKNAIVVFSPDKRLYTDGAKGRVRPCLEASRCQNIAITGQGILDGNGEHWRPVKRGKVSDVEWRVFHDIIGGVDRDKGQLFYPWDAKAGYANIADAPERQERMRNDLIRLTDCENVLIEGITAQNAPRFHVHPCNCRNVIVDGVTVRCPWNAQNGDAIDFSDVNVGLVVNCTVDAGDDGICMKSSDPKRGSPANGVEDVVVQNNTVYHAHGAFVLGSNTVSGVRRVVVRSNRFSGTDTGLRFKSGIGRGGRTEQLYIEDCVMTDIKDQAVIFQCDYVDRPAGSDPKMMPTFTEQQLRKIPDFQDIHISNITCRGAHTAIKASGIEGRNCVHDIDIRNSTFVYTNVGEQTDPATAQLRLTNVRLVKEE